MVLDYDDAVAEARLLHAREEGCAQPSSDALFFSIFRKTGGRPSQRSYRMNMLDEVVAATAGQSDTYLSQSAFWKFGRQIAGFRQVRVAWVDLDAYNLGRKVDASFIQDVVAHAQSVGIPAPTAIIYSGRGCYLKWLFETPVHASQLVVWQSLQRALTATFLAFAADTLAMDAARVFRLLDTTNSKSGMPVVRVGGSGQLHNFGSLCASVSTINTDNLRENNSCLATALSKSKRKAATGPAVGDLQVLAAGRHLEDGQRLQHLTTFSELHRPVMLPRMTGDSLNWARYCDLRDVFLARGSIPKGERDKAFFWMLNCLAKSGVVRACSWEREARDLLCAFPSARDFNPVDDGSMQSLIKRLRDHECGVRYSWKGQQVDPLYRPSNDFLIDAFGITSKEQEGLATLIDKDERRRRVDLRAPGRAERRLEREGWRADVMAVFKQAQAAERGGEPMEAADSRAASAAVSAEPVRINVSQLALSMGVARIKVSRYLADLRFALATDQAAQASREKSADPQHKVKPGRAPAPAPVTLPAHSHGARKQRAAQRELDRAVLAMRQAKEARAASDQLATRYAQAQQAVTQLSLERKLSQLSESWARRALAAVLDPTKNVAARGGCTDPVHGPQTHEDNEMTTVLQKKQRLLRAAQGLPVSAAISVPAETAAAPLVGSPCAPAMREPDAAQHARILAEGLTPVVAQALAMAPAEEPPAAPQAMDAQAIALARPYHEQLKRMANADGHQASEREAQARVGALSDRASRLAPLSVASRSTNEPVAALMAGGAPAPAGYPSEGDWPANDIAPGSLYNEAEWAAAEAPDENGFTAYVVEMHLNGQACLFRCPRPKEVRRAVMVGATMQTQTEHQFPPQAASPGSTVMLGQIHSRCILVGMLTRPQFPAAAEGDVIWPAVADGQAVRFRVIRPRQDYLLAEHAWRVGAKTTLGAGFTMGGARESAPQSSGEVSEKEIDTEESALFVENLSQQTE